MSDRSFPRDTPEPELQFAERDDAVTTRFEIVPDPAEEEDRLEERLTRLEIFERYGHVALRSGGAGPVGHTAARDVRRDFEIAPQPASDRDSTRQPPEVLREQGIHPDLVGTPHDRTGTVGHVACWTAVVAANLPLAPPPVPEPLALGPQFPTLRIVESELPPDVDERVWFARSFDFWTFDRSIDDRAGFRFHLTVRTADPGRTLPQILTRCQRLFDRRNAASACSAFDRILKAHRGIHDLSRPLVRAEYDHALDVWQWVLRLDRDATSETQIAALFHDVDRLLNEPASRTDLMAADALQRKQDHEEAGAWIAEQVLGASGLSAASVDRICRLIELHGIPGGDPEAMVINEADALSFFSFNSPGFFDYFDAAHCRTKVDETLARLGSRGMALLPTIFLRPDVAAMVREASARPRREG